MVVKKSGQPRKTNPIQVSKQTRESPRTWIDTYFQYLKQRAQRAKQKAGPIAKRLQRITKNKKLPRDSTIQAKLLSSYSVRLVRCIDENIRMLQMLLDSEMEKHESLEQKNKQTNSELKELGSWIGLPVQLMSEDAKRTELNVIGNELAKARLPYADINDRIQNIRILLSRKPRGKPVTRRTLAVEALERKQASGLSWNQLAWEFCQSGHKHKFPSREAMRQEVMALHKVLRKYKISY